MVFGHTHNWNIKQEAGIHLINLPPTAYVFREGRPSGWVAARVGEDGLTLKLHALDKQHKQHGETHELKYR